jgi:hypothetical protein
MLTDLFYPLFRWLTGYMGRAGLILYGGGNKTPPPDPRLVDAQIEALNKQTSATEGMTAAQTALHPYQIEQMKFSLMAANTAYEDSREDRVYALERRGELTGLQDRMISDAEMFNSAAKQEEMAGNAIADVGLQAGIARESQARSLARMGVNPNSGKTLATANQMSMAEASAKAAAGNQARASARQEGYALTDRATNALSGYPTFGAQATNASAANGLAGLTAANQASAGIMSGYDAIGVGAGRAGSTAGNLYNSQLSAWGQGEQAAASEEAGMWAGAGALAGYAMLAFSDARLKTDVRKIGDDPRGFGWYEYEYVWGGGRRVGVMAQEVAKVIPQAVHEVGGFLAVDYSLV